jgi:hypothetical protein
MQASRIGTLEHFEQKWEWTFARAGVAPARNPLLGLIGCLENRQYVLEH